MAAIVAFSAGCAKQQKAPQQPPAGSLTVDFVKAGTDELMPVAYTIDPRVTGSQLAEFAVTQLLAGPPTGRDTVVLFPSGTRLDVTIRSDTAVVDLSGPLQQRYSGGAEDESAMFKSLTYTLTNISGVSKVQVTIGGQRRAALSGGHLELDEPLTRETFAQ